VDRGQALAFIGPLLPQVERLHQLYFILDKARKKRGAIEFETSEVRFVLGPQGEVTQAGMIQRNDAHKLIEECMIAANVEAAKFLLDKQIPAPYRDHDKPPEAKFGDLLEFLKEFKLRMPPWAKVQPRDFRQLLEIIRDRPDAALLESVVLRSQSLAVYAPGNIGHFGLALAAYAHFTSIRTSWCIVRSSTRWPEAMRIPICIPCMRWRRCRCSVRSVRAAQTRRNARSTNVTARHGWSSTSVASSSGPSAV
jgi:ribonuclease R